MIFREKVKLTREVFVKCQLFQESKKRFDEDADFKKRAYECVVKLQSEEPEFIKVRFN